MYVNFELFRSKKLHPEDLYYLVGIKLKDKNVLEDLTTDAFARFEELGLLTSIKGKKGDNPIYNVRLSKKGLKLTNDLSFEGVIDEEAKVLTKWLVAIYKKKNGGIVKNKTEISRQLQWFKAITLIKGNRLATLLQSFILDTYNEASGLTVKEFMEQNPRGVLSNMLDKLCFNPTSVFDKHKTLDKSPLYKYFEDNQEYIEKMWESKNL